MLLFPIHMQTLLSYESKYRIEVNDIANNKYALLMPYFEPLKRNLKQISSPFDICVKERLYQTDPGATLSGSSDTISQIKLLKSVKNAMLLEL